MDISKDNLNLDRAEIVLAMKNLVIKRIVRTYEFKTLTHYVMRTQLLFRNLSTYKCSVVPGEFYEKEILIDFKAYDRVGVKGILISSDENDRILIKYIFLKMIEDIDKSSFDQEIRLKAKKVLCFQFTGQKEYLDLGYISSVDIERILDKKFHGPIATGFFNTMWEDRRNMNDYLNVGLIENIPAEYGETFKDIRNIRIKDICSQDTQNFILRFDKYFLQLILLKTPINPNEYSTLTLETDKFRSSQKKCYKLSEKVELRIDICPLLPLKEKSTSHYMIKPPDGVQFRRGPFWRHALIKPRRFLSLRKKIINPECFDILHDSSSKRCVKTLRLLKISQRSASSREVLREIFKPKEEKSSLDIRAQIKQNLIFLYFRSSREGKEDLCSKNHKLNVNIGLERLSVCIFHYILIFFLSCMILLCSHWFLGIRADSNLEIPNSFWSFAFFVVAQSITIIFDYFRRNDAQRYFMRSNILFILFLDY